LRQSNAPPTAQIYGVEEGALIMELVEGEPLKGPLPVGKIPRRRETVAHSRRLSAGQVAGRRG
jgi:hypothetical protein